MTKRTKTYLMKLSVPLIIIIIYYLAPPVRQLLHEAFGIFSRLDVDYVKE
ncbi:hypothetical protein [Peptoclostridium litorale]|nr:hypothetical protein [Peptoclostridium litorale]